MNNRLAEHVRSNVVGYIALFFAFTGMAHALASNSVKSKHIKDGQVQAQDLGDEAVTAEKLAQDSVDDGHVIDDSLGGEDINEAELDQSILQRRIGADCQAGQLVQGVAADGTLTCAGAGGLPSGPAGGDLTGEYPDPTIAPNSVGSVKVANESLTGDDVLDGTINGVDITDSSIGGNDIFDASLTTEHIDESTLFNDNSLTGGDISDDTVTGDDISDGSLTSADIAGPIQTCSPFGVVYEFGRLCVSTDGGNQDWYGAMDFCSGLGLRLPNLGEAYRLADNFDLSALGVSIDEPFWTDGYYFSESAFFAPTVAKKNPGNPDPSSSPLSSSAAALCVAEPTA